MRRIIWSDGERLSVDQTAERIHKQSGVDAPGVGVSLAVTGSY